MLLSGQSLNYTSVPVHRKEIAAFLLAGRSLARVTYGFGDILISTAQISQ